MKLGSSKSMDMTSGVIWRQLVAFAVPLLIGNILQQAYNTVDSVTVGRFVSKQALAAVTSTDTLINIVVGLFTGISMGATVVISTHFGAKNEERFHAAVHTTICLTILMGVAITVIGVACSPLFLRLMSTTDDVVDDALTYLRIYFAGALGLVMYNMLSGILRAVGDSKRPLIALVITSLLNIALDVLLVVVIPMGVAGVAIATIFSQCASAGYLLLLLLRTEESYRLVVRDIRIDGPLAGSIVKIGLPYGIQKSLVSFSNTLVIAKINSFGSGATAAWGVYRKIDELFMNSVHSMSSAISTFTGQNMGARKEERVRRGYWITLAICVGFTVVMGAAVILFRQPLVRLFNTSPDVIEYGSDVLRRLVPLMFFFCIAQVSAGEMQGRGDSIGPMIILLIANVAIRQIYLNVLWPYFPTFAVVTYAYPIGWSSSAVIMVIYLYCKRKRAPLRQPDAAGR